MSNRRCPTGLIHWQQVQAGTLTMGLVLILHLCKNIYPFWGLRLLLVLIPDPLSWGQRLLAVAGGGWPWSAKALLDGNARRILHAEAALINAFPAGWLIHRWVCMWAIPGLCSINMCNLGKRERIQTVSIPLSAKISLSPLLVTPIAFIFAAFWDIKALHHTQSISLIPSLKQWSWVLKQKRSKQPGRQQGACF